MAFYKKIYNEKFGIWYPAAVTMGQPIPLKQVANRLSQMSTVTMGDVLGVLGNLPGVMADYMAQGKSVRLDGLGTFRYTLNTTGVANEADFDFQKQVKAIRVQFVPSREGAVTKGGTATRTLVPAGIEWRAFNALEDPDEGSEPGGGGTGGGTGTGGGEDEDEGGSTLG